MYTARKIVTVQTFMQQMCLELCLLPSFLNGLAHFIGLFTSIIAGTYRMWTPSRICARVQSLRSTHLRLRGPARHVPLRHLNKLLTMISSHSLNVTLLCVTVHTPIYHCSLIVPRPCQPMLMQS